jgi:hypothetical protein
VVSDRFLQEQRLFSEHENEAIVDQINFQASGDDTLRTKTARQIAAPLVATMRAFLIQLESQVGAGRPSDVRDP